METVASDLGLLDRKPEYLINAMEWAGQRENPHNAGYGEKRRAVFEYIAGLQSALAEAKAEIERLGVAVAKAEYENDVIRDDNGMRDYFERELKAAEERIVKLEAVVRRAHKHTGDHGENLSCPYPEHCVFALALASPSEPAGRRKGE